MVKASKINSIFLSLVFLVVGVSLQGQTDYKADKLSRVKVSVKKYEVLQTKIYTMDNQLVYANTELALVGEETSVVDLDNLSKQPGLNAKTLKKQPILASNSNSESILFYNNNNILPNNFFSIKENQSSRETEQISIGYPNNHLANVDLTVAGISTSSSRSITELPGYVPLAGFNLKLK